MQADDTAFCEMVRRVRANLDHGLLGDDGDYDALTERLDGCRSVADVSAFQREALRWDYATRPLDPWEDWESVLVLTRN